MFSIIIPCDNRWDLLQKSLAEGYYKLHDIPAWKAKGLEFIVLTRSKDVRYPPPGIDRLIHYEFDRQECNPALALNMGVKAAKNDVVLITCPEVMPLTPVLDQFAEVYGKTVLAHTVEGDQVLLSSQYGGKNPGLYYLAMYSKATLLAINGWDEDFMKGRGCEDTDFGWRYNRTGLPVSYRDDIKALHQTHPRNPNPQTEMDNIHVFNRNNRLGLIRPKNGLKKLTKILLHSNQLGLGGTEVALWEYALGCAETLKYEVTVAAPKRGRNHPGVIQKFSSAFPLILYSDLEELRVRARGDEIDIAYFIVEGRKQEELLIPGVRNVIHAVFPLNEPFGDVYAYVSSWASSTSEGKIPWVPHIVKKREVAQGNLRRELDIPYDAIVFGGYGSPKQFDIPFVHETVKRVSSSMPKTYFLFMNFEPFMEQRENVRFLEGTHDEVRKEEFINTCNAMLHGRSRGETFGLAVAEFSSSNKPVITYEGVPERAHIEILGNKAILYQDEESLQDILEMFRRPLSREDFNAYKDFSREKVMAKFQEVFVGRRG